MRLLMSLYFTYYIDSPNFLHFLQAISGTQCCGITEWKRWKSQEGQAANSNLAWMDWTGYCTGKMGKSTTCSLFKVFLLIAPPYLIFREDWVIPFNCITHPFCASFLAWLARARARAPSELDRFSMKAELFREINGRFLLNELGDPHFLIHKFKWHTV